MTEAIDLMKEVNKLCPVINMNAASDLQVAIKCLKTAVYGASYNVLINVENMHWNRRLKESVSFLLSCLFYFQLFVLIRS